jgi:hypothetical protein
MMQIAETLASMRDKTLESVEILKVKHKEICFVDLHLKLQTDSRLSSTSNCTQYKHYVYVSLLLLHWARKQNINSKNHSSCKKTPNINPDYCKSFDLKKYRMPTFVLQSRTKSQLPLPPIIIIIISCKRYEKEE